MKLKIDRLVALALGVALAVAFVVSQRPRHPVLSDTFAATQERRKARVVQVRAAEVKVFAEGIGTVRSRRQTQVASRVLAEVKEIRRHPGDPVEAGEVLVILDSLDLKARAEQAEANLKASEESLREAETEYDRAKSLLQKEAVTQQQYDMASFRLAETRARRDAASKALEEARIQLGYATVAAPFKGVIYDKQADPGDLATPGKPLLGMYDPGQLRLEALVEETLLWKLKLKDELAVSIDALAKTLKGQVSEAVPAVDPSTRTGTVKIDLPLKEELRPGMFGRARIPVGTRSALVVPAAAVVRRGQLELLFVVDMEAKPEARKVRMLLVRSAPLAPASAAGAETVEILSGLEPGAFVVASDADALRDGDLVDAAWEAEPRKSEDSR